MSDPRPPIGARVRFAPNPRWPDRTVDAEVIRHRRDSHFQHARRTNSALGWLDTVDADGVERSVRPSRATVIQESAHV
jgi:hypothetical protein